MSAIVIPGIRNVRNNKYYIVKIFKLRFDFEWYDSLNNEKQCYMVPS